MQQKILRHSKTKLRALAVILAGYQILHMEEYELVRKITQDHEIPLDLEKQEEIELETSVKYLESVAINILKSMKIHKEDELFFMEKCGVILETYFETGIAERGISAHIAFATLLFRFFADGNSKRYGEEFIPLVDIDLYNAIFDKIDRSHIIDWQDHYDSSGVALFKGVGTSISFKYPAIIVNKVEVA